MQWYYADASEQQHSVDESQIPELISNGTLLRSTLVWNESMADWIEAGQARPDWFGAAASGPVLAPATVAAQAPASHVGPASAKAPTDSLAICSLVFGILSLLCLGFLAGIPAIICGHMARKKAAMETLPSANGGLALAGLVTGYIGTVFSVIGFIIYFVAIIGAAASGEFN